MCDFLKGKDLELRDIVQKGTTVPMAKDDKGIVTGLKKHEQYYVKEVKDVQKNDKAKKILICCIILDEYNCISTCTYAKQIWDALQIAHEGANHVSSLILTYSQVNMSF